MRTLRLLFVCCVLVGCDQTTGDKIDLTNADQVRIGTPKATVEALLGQPTNKSVSANGNESWMYNYNQMKSNAGEKMATQTALLTVGTTVGAFIPGVGLIAPIAAGAGLVANGASGTDVATQNETLLIDFKKGVVSRCMLQRATTTAHTNAFGTTGGKTSNAEINCGQIKGSTESPKD
jgi:outer membrane protein assembly factor BamE (lipoprotein component of BamABCDE complex)